VLLNCLIYFVCFCVIFDEIVNNANVIFVLDKCLISSADSLNDLWTVLLGLVVSKL